MQKVLLIEPDKAFAELMKVALGGQVEFALVNSAQAAIDWLDQPGRKVDLVITELFLGQRSGIEVINELRSHADWLEIPVVVHTRAVLTYDLEQSNWQQNYGVVGLIHKGPGSLTKLRHLITAKQLV